MNAKEALDLKKLSQQYDYKDNTDGIRKLKHSDLILEDIMKLEKLKKTYSNEKQNTPTYFETICRQKCSFLYNTYTDIFNKLVKDELNLNLMTQALGTLKQIEQGNIDQEEGSVVMGKLLHKVFVESALKRGKNIDDENKKSDDIEVKNAGSQISWKDYKMKKMQQK